LSTIQTIAIFAFGVALLAFAWAAGRLPLPLPLPRLTLHRQPPGRAAVGLTCAHKIEVRNRGASCHRAQLV
jgi:hypothetical protein